MCDQCRNEDDAYMAERKRLLEWMINNPQPCIVCRETNVVGAGTWMADKTRYLAVGAHNIDRIFAFSVCEVHIEPTEENEKLIAQAIVRLVRSGNGTEV